MNPIELVFTILLGYLFFLAEEFQSSALVALSSVILPSIITIPLSISVFRKSTSLVAFSVVTSTQILLTALLRPGLVYGGLVSYLKGVDAFGMLGLNSWTYVIFIISGILPAYCIKRYDPGTGFRVYPIVLSSFGVLFTYKLAQGFWFPVYSLNGMILLAAEFTSPVVYTFVGIWAARYWSRKYHGDGA